MNEHSTLNLLLKIPSTTGEMHELRAMYLYVDATRCMSFQADDEASSENSSSACSY